MASLFTKIINRELPGYIIDEDDQTFTFLALDQVNLGHALVIPKKEVNHFLDAEDSDYHAVFAKAKTVGKAIQKATNCERVVAIIAGFEVPHFHLHLIPAWGLSDVNFAKAKRRTDEEMKQICESIRSYL